MLYNILKQLINALPAYSEPMLSSLGLIQYIKEFRTIELNLPRQIGKTCAIARLSTEISSLVLTGNQLMANTLRKDRGVFAISDIYSYVGGNLGQRNHYNGMKYRAILVDERTSEDIWVLLSFLLASDLLEKDFFILKVGTK